MVNGTILPPRSGAPFPAVSVSTLLQDAAVEDLYDDDVKAAEAAVEQMKLGSPEPS